MLKTVLLTVLWLALVALVLSPFVFMMLAGAARQRRKVGKMRELAMPYKARIDDFEGLACPGECCDDPGKCPLRPTCESRFWRPLAAQAADRGKIVLDPVAIFARWNSAKPPHPDYAPTKEARDNLHERERRMRERGEPVEADKFVP